MREGWRERDGRDECNNEEKDLQYVELVERVIKTNVKFMRTARKIMEEMELVPFDMTIY